VAVADDDGHSPVARVGGRMAVVDESRGFHETFASGALGESRNDILWVSFVARCPIL
jgi:hypothetical protein